MRQETASGRERGQGLTEYMIITSLVAIAAIGVVTLFGDNVRRLFGASADALGGNTSISNPNTTKASATKTQEKTLQNFGENNSYK